VDQIVEAVLAAVEGRDWSRVKALFTPTSVGASPDSRSVVAPDLGVTV
jgi:hypothetical protein